MDKLPDVVAKVNGIEIVKSELLIKASMLRGQLERAGYLDPGANSKQLLDQALDLLIGEVVLFDDLQKRGLAASEAEVNDSHQMRSAGDDASLKAQGITAEPLRAKVRQRLTLEKYLVEQKAKVAGVTKAEAKAYYEENEAEFVGEPEVRVRLVRVVIEVPGDAPARERARQKAESAHRKLLAGESFAAVLKEYSDQPLITDETGELEPFSPGDDVVDVAVAKLEVNQFTPVVELDDSFQIAQLLEKLPASKISFESALPWLETMLAEQKLRDTVTEKINALRSVAKIEKAY